MKMCKIWTVIAIAVITLLTSCLGESSTKQDFTQLPGVVCFYKNKLMVKTAQGYIYSPALLTTTYPFSEDDCVLVSFQYDSSIPENADAVNNGFVYVTLSDITLLDKGYVNNAQTDTTKLITNEFALKKAVAFSYWPYADYQLGYLFLTTTFSKLKNQTSIWQLYFDLQQEPVSSTDGNGNIYSLFMRAVKTGGTTPPEDVYTVNAYNMEYYINTINERERANNGTKFQLKINYIKEIAEDSTFTWAASDMLKFEVPKKD